MNDHRTPDRVIGTNHVECVTTKVTQRSSGDAVERRAESRRFAIPLCAVRRCSVSMDVLHLHCPATICGVYSETGGGARRATLPRERRAGKQACAAQT